MKLGTFLWQRLREAGLEDVFGVPGDFSLGLMNYLMDSDVNYVGTCNELNAAYAADGYARLHGIGGCVVTYAVGEISGMNGIAGAWAESVPVVCVVGAPAREFFARKPLLHHTLGDYTIPKQMYEKITAAQTILDNPATAVDEIDRVLTACIQHKKPVYISVPADMVQCEIKGPQHPFKVPEREKSDPDALKEVVDEISKIMNGAKLPLYIPGIELIRRDLGKEFESLVETTKIPFATMLLSKGILPEESDKFIGIFSGDRSRDDVKQRVRESDSILVFGEKMTDFNTGGFTAGFTNKNSIYVGYNYVRVNQHYYHDVYIHDVLRDLVQVIKPRKSKEMKIPDGDATFHKPEHSRSQFSQDLTMKAFFERMTVLFEENCIVMAETGASLFSAANCKLPHGATFIGQTFYGSIGYTIGACLGASIYGKKHNRQVYLFVGDGSLQVTAQDISTMVRHQCTPYIFCINNDGYTIERTIYDNSYNDIQMWKYYKLPEIFGGEQGHYCKTEGELEDGIKRASKRKTVEIFEIVLDKWDCSELLLAAGKLMRRNSRLDLDSAQKA
eukprot:Blabericola_migrator_1__12805@NODE_824_length_6371_cov_16_326459_g581_i0_p2_GENE_NODE_824_length_6371_cov_16_326459_g581_i0NODE_824_length_6371_cov_16_326459_g581_i0_p2_ORF_typecomplete_len559_score120_58TPP_enzyme_N/PF02776_18/3_3e41TPP_enzyme_N/PF02776_18/9_8e03TPP_enzyme_C/PF02775_21/1_6e02TPP_enzyme_C/PF02775_21/9_3e27TPP_enzyme_M/PF00205_22/1_6e17Transketolase_N/PF00456_21/0_06_NODE_824_length_6371_cov_16_326459_g581_i046296305